MLLETTKQDANLHASKQITILYVAIGTVDMQLSTLY
jgi:hypothetical protein